MNDPFQLVVWAIAIGISWIMLSTLTGCDRWVRSLFGQRDKVKDLEAQIKALDARIKELEKKP